eukprot:Opistho-2@37399
MAGTMMQMCPTPEAYAGYACATCNAQNAAMRCARCQRLWYCNRECQKSDFKTHKDVCKAIASWNLAEKEGVVTAWEPTPFAADAQLPSKASADEVLRFKSWNRTRLTYLRMLIGRELESYESKTVLSTAKCQVCLAIRRTDGGGDRLIPCENGCGSAYCCSESHWAAARDAHNGPSMQEDGCSLIHPTERLTNCDRATNSNRAEGFLRTYVKDGNNGVPVFVSESVPPRGYEVHDTWASYLRWREYPMFAAGFLCHALDALFPTCDDSPSTRQHNWRGCTAAEGDSRRACCRRRHAGSQHVSCVRRNPPRSPRTQFTAHRFNRPRFARVWSHRRGEPHVLPRVHIGGAHAQTQCMPRALPRTCA